jgi:hypothetical protein
LAKDEKDKNENRETNKNLFMTTIKAIIRPKNSVKRCLFNNSPVKKILFQLQQCSIYFSGLFPHTHMGAVA